MKERHLFDFVICLILTGLFLIAIFIFPAFPADSKTCTLYALRVAELVKKLTNDDDVAQASWARAEAYCVVLDEPPLTEPAPKAVLKAPKGPSAHVIACRKNYRSYDAKTDTVLPNSRKTRVKCTL